MQKGICRSSAFTCTVTGLTLWLSLCGWAQNNRPVQYSGNKLPDAQCGAQAPSPLDLKFSCRLVPHGSGPADVMFSMKNSSGCRVAVKGVGKVTGTQGHVYATNPPGASQSLGSHTDGFSFEDTRTPFGQVVAPNTQEDPASCEIDGIEACSATAPPNFPANTYFRPFLDGKCTRFQNVGPLAIGTSKTCAAVRVATAYTDSDGSFLVYGFARSQFSDDAAARAKEAAKENGGRLPDVMDEAMDRYYLQVTCEKPHGAIATALKQGASRPSVFQTVRAYFDDDLEAAESKALSLCNAPNSYGNRIPQGDCKIDASW